MEERGIEELEEIYYGGRDVSSVDHRIIHKGLMNHLGDIENYERSYRSNGTHEIRVKDLDIPKFMKRRYSNVIISLRPKTEKKQGFYAPAKVQRKYIPIKKNIHLISLGIDRPEGILGGDDLIRSHSGLLKNLGSSRTRDTLSHEIQHYNDFKGLVGRYKFKQAIGSKEDYLNREHEFRSWVKNYKEGIERSLIQNNTSIHKEESDTGRLRDRIKGYDGNSFRDRLHVISNHSPDFLLGAHRWYDGLNEKNKARAEQEIQPIIDKYRRYDISNGLRSNNPEDRSRSILDNKSTIDHIKQGMVDEHPMVRQAAIDVANRRGYRI